MCVCVCSVVSDSLPRYWNGLPFSPLGDLPNPEGGPVSGSRAKAHPTGLDGGPPELAGAHIDFRALHGIRAGKERPEILRNVIKLV